MDLDHRRDQPKFFNPGSAYGSSSTKRDVYRRSQTTEEILLTEIAKCDVVCTNWHRQRGHDRAYPTVAPKFHPGGVYVDEFGEHPDMNAPPHVDLPTRTDQR